MNQKCGECIYKSCPNPNCGSVIDSKLGNKCLRCSGVFDDSLKPINPKKNNKLIRPCPICKINCTKDSNSIIDCPEHHEMCVKCKKPIDLKPCCSKIKWIEPFSYFKLTYKQRSRSSI